MAAPQKFHVGATATLREAMRVIDRGGKGIALVVDDRQRLVATVTDGDARRALLAGRGLEEPLEALLAARRAAGGGPPVTVPEGTARSEIRERMRAASLRHIPVVDGAGRVVDLVLLEELIPSERAAPRAVLMAGGRGSRLHPLTATTPKPMLPLGDRPLLERIVGQLRDVGVRRIEIATHHLGEVIRSHFGTGEAFGVDIRYVQEEQPLGTAGALGLVGESEEPWLVVNGDVVTDVDFRAFIGFHEENAADVTVAVRSIAIDVPFGVVDLEGSRVRSLREKPSLAHFVAAGIYLVGPAAQRLVPPGTRQDMPDLIRRFLEASLRVVAFPIHEYWIDIGRPDDYERASAHVSPGRAP